ncbi:MAG: hypothetical protein ACO1SV_05630 [Fimbriimonas sp.]
MGIATKMKALLVGAVVVAGASYAGAQTMRMGNRYTPMPVLRNPAARADLKLTPEQVKAIDAVFPKFEPGKPMMFTPGQMEEAEAKALKTLNGDQRKRLDQLVIQFHAPMVVLREDIAKKVGLTAEQRGRIEEAQQSEFRKAAEGAMNGGGRVRIGPEVMERVRATASKILTPAQRATLAKLGGKPVKLR